MLTHDNVVASIESFHRIIPPMEHRIVSLLPLSHLLEQAVGLYYALDVGADILYVRSRNPRVIFDALRDHRVTSMVVVPQVLDLFWSAIEREVEKRGRTKAFDRLRSVARHLPMRFRPRLFRRVHAQLGGHFRLFVSAGAFLPPALQQAWEDIGVTVLQGYGATETGTGTCDDARRPRAGHGRPSPRGDRDAARRRTARSSSAARPCSRATGTRPRRPRPRSPTTAGTGPATSAISTTSGRLVLSGRSRDMIVLPNGFNVYPEDIENALRVAGHPRRHRGRDEARADRGHRPGGERQPGGATAAAALGATAGTRPRSGLASMRR